MKLLDITSPVPNGSFFANLLLFLFVKFKFYFVTQNACEKNYRKNPEALVEKERDDDLDVVFSRFEITGSQVWVGWQHEYLNAE